MSPAELASRTARAAAHNLRILLRSSLIRNGYALIANAGLTSAFGLLFWLLAARLYTADELGRGAALISTLTVLGNVAQLGFGNVLNRFLPTAGPQAGKLIVIAYAVGTVMGLILSTVTLFGLTSVFPQLRLVDGSWAAGWFVLSVVAWTIFLLEDSVLAGLRQAVWVPVNNTVYAVAKIVLLLPLAGTALTAFGPFVAWTLPVLAIVLGVNALIFRQFSGQAARDGSSGKLPGLSQMAAFLSWDYVGTLAMMTAIGLAPLIVLSELGASANATYYLAWTMTYSIYLLGRSMSISLLAEGAADARRLPALAADALLHTLVLMAIGATMIVILAPFIMTLFGQHYLEDGTPLLRVLSFACIPWGVTTIFLAAARARGKMAAVAVVQLATMALVLGVGWMLVGRLGILGMGLAWLLAHTLVALGVGAMLLRTGGRDHVNAWLLDLGASAARAVNALRSLRKREQTEDPRGNEIAQFISSIDDPNSSSWRLLKSLPSRGSVLIDFVGEPIARLDESEFEPPAGTRCILKRGVTEEGRASLVRQHRRLAMLRGDARLKSRQFELPEILAFLSAPETVWSAERLIPGRDGRIVVDDPATRPAAVAAAIAAMAWIHSRTAQTVRIDRPWITKWIERPAKVLEQPVRTLMSRQERQRAIANFVDEQTRYWSGRESALGWFHGDFGPGNVLYRTFPGKPAPAEYVEGIVDWDRSGADGPDGFDACQMALAMRRIAGGQEFGAIIRELYLQPRWSAEELEIFKRAGAGSSERAWINDPEALRTMLGLVWLTQVTSNIDKNGFYLRNRLWSSSNIERVLLLFANGDPRDGRLQPGNDRTA